MTRLAKIAAFFGLTGVALGAFGAHALKPALERLGTVETWHTASNYHLLHAVALLSLVVIDSLPASSQPLRNPRLSAWLWSGGILLFSGSLYTLSLTGIRWFGAITPLGGLLFLAGWASLAPPRRREAR